MHSRKRPAPVANTFSASRVSPLTGASTIFIYIYILYIYIYIYIQGVDKKSGHPLKYGYFGITFAREQELMENDMFLECM